VEDDVLWGEGRENMVVGKRGEGRRWTDGKGVAASSAVGMTSSRRHGKTQNAKNTNGRASPLSGVLLIYRDHIIGQILINK